jgi:hypothetical protein
MRAKDCLALPNLCDGAEESRPKKSWRCDAAGLRSDPQDHSCEDFPRATSSGGQHV